MKPPHSPSRRRLLGWTGAAGMLAALDRTPAHAQAASDYKALVCIYLQGGNDGENTLVRVDSPGYQAYAAIRTPASGISIAQKELLPVQPAGGGPPFGFHPACAALQALFDRRELAVVANVGQLVRPVTKAALETQGAPRPANLFSHNDQELAQQSADASGFTRIGWGGRMADRLDAFNAGTLFPPVVSTNTLRTFCSGERSIPLTVPAGPWWGVDGSGDFNKNQYDALRNAAMQELVSHSRDNTYELVARLYAEQGLSSASVVAPITRNDAGVAAAAFAGIDSDIGRQLKTVALLIEGRAETGLRRQLFYSHQIGYDTHGAQLGIHHRLLGDLSTAVKAFSDAMKALGLADRVTVFTLSDFGRALKPAGDQGTDHGWGNYAFVAGGAVKGGDFYGTIPTLALNGPDDLGKEGRWIPTTSLEQYGATLCRWFGIAEGDLPYVFPNIGAFANTNLGFMS
ncbi:MAG: DUF1501 domain-containing protein [Burkholderiales bacterium]|nr:DUF1501 domain-containing protein [Burkholderiales bacterium]